MMKSGWLLFFMLISMVSALGQTRIDERNLWGRDEVKHAAIGVCVKNVETGQVVYEHNPGMALRPASVIKLLSSALALKREGDSLTYTTRVFYTETLLFRQEVIRHWIRNIFPKLASWIVLFLRWRTWESNGFMEILL